MIRNLATMLAVFAALYVPALMLGALLQALGGR